MSELWQWAEYYCPWCYIAAVRLRRVEADYAERVVVRRRSFPLELLRGEGPPRDILEQEWWVAALQEPEAEFSPYPADDWPQTTLPAFEAIWAVARQNEGAVADFDLRIRRAFFAQGRNIGRREVLTALADEAELDLPRFERDFGSLEARRIVEDEARLGRERYQVRGTPTLMLADGTRLSWTMAFPKIRDRRIVSMGRLPCCGSECDDGVRELFQRAERLQPVPPRY